MNEVIFNAVGPTKSGQLLSDLPDSQINVTQYSLKLKNTALQSIPNTTATALIFNNIPRNVNFAVNPLVTSSRIAIPASGLWLCAAEGVFDANAVGFREMYFLVNGGTKLEGALTLLNAGGAATVSIQISKPIVLSVGDYIEAYVVQNSGGALSIGSAPTIQPTEFCLSRLSN